MIVPMKDNDVNSQIYLHYLVEDIKRYDSFIIDISYYGGSSAIISISNCIDRGFFHNRVYTPDSMIPKEYPTYGFGSLNEYDENGNVVRKKISKCKRPNPNTLYYSRYAVIKRYKKMCEIYNTYVGEFPKGKKEYYI